jgi:hypothetical protein
MKLSLQGKKSSIEVAEAAFGADFNEPLVHQVVTAYLAGARSGTKAQKRRSDVRGGGAKPWRLGAAEPSLRGRETLRRRSTEKCTAVRCARCCLSSFARSGYWSWTSSA